MNWISRTMIAATGLAALATLPAAANAAVSAYATGSVNMRTCGSTRCARITAIPAGAPVTIYGCTSGYGWCDTQYGRYRGWVSGRYLQATAPGYASPSPVPAVGALLGITILGAAVAGSYGYGGYYGYGYGYPYGGYYYPYPYRYPYPYNYRYPRQPRNYIPSYPGNPRAFGTPRYYYPRGGGGPNMPMSSRGGR